MLTKRELLTLWERHRFKANKKLGQNFLIDKNIKDKIINFVNPVKSDIIVEIGAGFGELTVDLSRKAGKVIAFEADKRIPPMLKGSVLAGLGNVEIINADYLKYGARIACDKIVGNLPYCVTTPVLEKILRADLRKLEGAYIMVQKEYAARMLARPGTDDYSSLSCFVQEKTDVIRLMVVKKTCFYPVPGVDSVFLKIRPLAEPRIRVGDEKMMHNIIRASFQQRRKTLINSLSQGIMTDKEFLCRVFDSLGLDRNTRGENLSLADFARLADAIGLKKEGKTCGKRR